MPKPQKTRSEHDKIARQYIDKVAAINRRHGMGDHIPPETYQRVVQGTARLIRRARTA